MYCAAAAAVVYRVRVIATTVHNAARVKRMCARGLGVYTFNDKACIHRVPFGNNIYNTYNMSSSSTVCSGGDRREGFIVCHALYVYHIIYMYK